MTCHFKGWAIVCWFSVTITHSRIPTFHICPTSCISISSKSNCISYPHYQNDLPKLTSSSTSIRSQIGRLDGVILLNWDDSTLERQIEYGVKMGEIEFEAAKAELRNFRRNVIPVAEYFDYKQLLYVVSRFRFSDFGFQFQMKCGCLFVL